MTNLRTIGDDLSYDSAANAVQINNPGTYLFIWSLLASPQSSEQTDVIVALESEDGSISYALSGNNVAPGERSVKVFGSTVATLTAGTRLALHNRSGSLISLGSSNGSRSNSFSGSLTAVRLF